MIVVENLPPLVTFLMFLGVLFQIKQSQIYVSRRNKTSEIIKNQLWKVRCLSWWMYTISILLLGILVLFTKLSNGEKFEKEKKEIYTWLSVVTLALTACFHLYILSYFLQMG